LTALVELVKESPDGPQRKRERVKELLNSAAFPASLLLSADDKLFDADRRQRALLAAAAAALAAERFRRDAGRWPESLAEMVPGYLNNVPTDPFDLRPLRYQRLSDGVLIHAVGWDGSVDGVAVHVPYNNQHLSDVGVRLWDVAHRRQPPKPADDGMKEP
jgi:hypothetical protein